MIILKNKTWEKIRQEKLFFRKKYRTGIKKCRSGIILYISGAGRRKKVSKV
jgi:hypothetical protein